MSADDARERDEDDRAAGCQSLGERQDPDLAHGLVHGGGEVYPLAALGYACTARNRPNSTTAGEYIDRILRARVYDVAVESALEPAKNLSRRLHNKVLLKREDLQAVFSFKLRGAYNKIANLSETAARRGVICASAGNHAQGVALAAQRLGCTAVIVTSTSIKIIVQKSIESNSKPTHNKMIRSALSINPPLAVKPKASAFAR